MSDGSGVSEARARAQRREAERQRLKEERRAESGRRRRSSGEDDSNDDPNDPNDPLAAERRAWRDRQKAKQGTTSAGAEFGAELSQEDQLIQRANQLQADNASTLRNTIKVARETTVVGASTIHKLNEQGEQFDRMNRALDDTNESLGRSERILRGMKSIGGAISNWFTSDKSKKLPKATPEGASISLRPPDGTDELEAKDRSRNRRKEDEGGASPWSTTSTTSSTSSKGGRSSSRNDGDWNDLTNGRSSTLGSSPNAKQSAAIAQFQSNQKAEDDALDELSDVLGTLKEQSQMINTQLTQHTQTLNGLGDKIDSTSDRLKKGSRTMQKIS